MTIVSCGLFGISEDYLEPYQSLDERFIKNRASTFFFEARGDSMEPIIFSKDVLIVDRAIKLVSGQIGVVVLEGQLICKRIVFKNKKVCLQSENAAYKEIILEDEQELVLWGVVRGLVRELV